MKCSLLHVFHSPTGGRHVCSVIQTEALKVESHGAVYFHHRRRGFFARKGSGSAALGALLQARGYKVRLRKLDPYLNLDPERCRRISTAKCS